MIRARESKAAPVGVVTRVLRILEMLHGAPTGMYLKDVAQATDINKSTVYRILAHLEREGYLFRGDGGAYFIGPKLTRLASVTNHHSVLREISHPVLQQLWEATGETVNLAVLDGKEVLYLDVLVSPHSFRLVSQPGMRRPTHCTSLGRAMLAYLPAKEQEALLSLRTPKGFAAKGSGELVRLRKKLAQVRKRGFAVDDQETTLGARCVGAPVFDKLGKVAAAVSVSGPTTRISRKQVPVFGAKAAEAARAISARLG